MPGAQGPKTVKGAQSDPNYVSRLLARSECLPGGAKIIVTPLSGICHLLFRVTVEIVRFKVTSIRVKILVK